MSHDLAPVPTSSVSTPGDPAVRGPAGWHSTDDIQTVAGLGGSFLWNENRFSPRVITFSFIPRPGPETQEGTYAIRSGLAVVEQGPFIAIPNNPATNFAWIVLQLGGPAQRSFVITGMLTDSNWRIYFMQLNYFMSNSPGFFATRIA